ncbi:non-ribosomal peptide synthetase [Chitinophaga rhizophila]|uniref:Amino acid adenylation domain-containing protein n=1 Tax=Chitinophaga rhizophila TaxID=2866212 RepID=A0ABS7GKE1_9BACT|nr:non-ribosomal peptide synthetase [Chitinophaga rhizophila]MBW8687224.1 amino acid adenylation domain-containing protein [Chitinophaga rhizophila]
MTHYNSLSEILLEKKHVAHKGITFIESGQHEHFVSYQELFEQALSSLYYLQQKGLAPGHELVLQIEDNSTFLTVFWACLLGGIIPVPLTVGQNDEHRQKLFNVWGVLHHPFLAIADADLDKMAAYAHKHQQHHIFEQMQQRSLSLNEISNQHTAGTIYQSGKDDLAFIQFSSGSTGKPKGVCLTHGNLLTNINAISTAARYTEQDVMLSWMPLTHDMGLIGFHLNPLCCGMQQMLMPTSTFIRRPALWMEKVTEHRVTVLSSPNFGYEYLLRHASISEEWDLSAVRILYNGAEPISFYLYKEFTAQLSIVGLSPRAVRPVYGLAEASLAVTMSGIGTPAETLAIDGRFTGRGEQVRVQTTTDAYTALMVNVGTPVPDCFLRIADEDNTPLPDLQIGEIQIRGENVTKGYYNNPDAAAALITADGWLKTGDLGFMREGQLYVTGRMKDVLFVNGQNFYSHDIEQVAAEVEGISLNKIVAAGRFNYHTQIEEAIAFVFHRGTVQQFLPLANALKRHINSRLGIVLDLIIPVRNIPRTTSGKLQRFKLIEQLDELMDTADEVARAMKDTQSSAGPRTATEETLAAIWREVLQHDAIGIYDDFFETGGNSLRAIEASMKISRAFNQSFPLQLLFEKRTIAALEAVVSSESTHSPVVSIPVLEYEPAELPASPIQQSLYYTWAREQDAVAYNIPVAFEIDGPVDADKLASCIRTLLERHDVFRMSFHLKDVPVIRMQKEVTFSMSVVSGDKGILRSLVQPFDLSKAPLCRATLISGSILFLDFHHIISDGISVSLFVDELFTLYAGGPLPALKVRYLDYAAWQQKGVNSTYWQQQLSGTLPVLELPLDRQRPAVFSTKGEKLFFELDADTTLHLRELAHKAGCTMQVLLFFVYKILLHKYSRQQDIVIGIPVAGRNHLDLLPLQGMFVNNLSIRHPLEPGDRFLHALKKEKEALLEAMTHQDVPFGEVLRQLELVRDPARQPIFDTMFVYQNMPMPEGEYDGLRIRPVNVDSGISKFDLTLEVYDDGTALRYQLEYATSLFNRSTIVTFNQRLNALLQHVLADPGTVISQLSLADAAPPQMSLPVDYPRDKTADQLFTLQVAARPEAIAIEYKGIDYTYKEIELRANAVAKRLQQEGITRGTIVALLFHRSPAFIIALLGVLKAGAAYVPVDPELPAERIAYILSDCRTPLVLTTSDLQDQYQHLPGIKVLADIYTDIATAAPAPAHTPDDLAYVIYTSGTTGNPKGAMIAHRSLVNYTSWGIRHYLKEQPATMPLYTAISFDLTITAIFPPLLSGNKIVIYDDSPGALVLEQILKDNKSVVVKITPSHLRLLRNEQLSRYIDEHTSIRVFVIGGESLETWLAADIYRLFQGNVTLYNEYGPTETTVGCMIHQFDPAEEWLSVPIGVPAANTGIYLLDENNKQVPEGLTGEIYIGGDGVGKGYLHNEVLTAQRFISDPFIPGNRMYKTGDIARMLPGGILLFLGRADRQVKINGFRIELAEIEQQLLAYTGIIEAVLDVTTGNAGQQYLVAYYRTEDEMAGLEDKQLKSYLGGRLPHYMIPAYFHHVPEIPLTNNGKVDTARLVLHHQPIAQDREEAATGITARVLQVWRDVLGCPEMHQTDNFFECGGDSIKGIQIATKLAAQGIQMKVRDILAYHTVEMVCMHIDAGTDSPVADQGIITGEKQHSPIEKWFFSQQFPQPAYYNQSVLLQLHHTPELARLQQAFDQLLAHHDGLRLNYNASTGKLFYNPLHLDAPFPIEEISTTEAALSTICERIKSGFDLQQGLLMRAALLHLADGRDMLFITAHHLVVDGVTWRILLEDLYQLLTREGTTLPLKTVAQVDWNQYPARKPLQVASFISADNELSDWLIADSKHYTLTMDAAMVTNVWQRYKADVGVLLNAALVKALALWTGKQKFVIEQERHGRNLDGADVSRTAGWFTVMYPLTIQDAGVPFPILIHQIQEEIRKSADSPDQLTGRVDVRFNYLGDFTRDFHNDLFSYVTLPTGRDVHGDNHMTARLELNAMIIDGVLQLDVVYNEKAFSKETIQDWMNILEQQIQLLSGEEERQVTPADFAHVNLSQEELDILF